MEGPSWPEPESHGGDRMIGKKLLWVWGILLAIWVLYSRLYFICPFFKDPDAAKYAFGIAQRLHGISYWDGAFYQIEKHIGYYVLYEFLAKIFQIDIAGLPHFMAVSCAWFMIGILVLNVLIAYTIWGGRVALVSSTLLAISPMMWITGEYPTALVPALFFFMLAVFTMVMSYRVKGGRWLLVVSGFLFAFSILVRLDMALGMLVPICYAHFVDKRGLGRALILYAISFLTVIIVLAGFDPNFWFYVFSIGPHEPNYPRSLTLNWWGMGPFLFVFAFAGFVYRFVTDRRPLPFIFFWIVAFNTFYTGHLYSGRYFIPYYPVISWLAAFSIIAFYGWLAKLVKYNRVMRIVFMLLIAFGASTMLTMSIMKEGDGSTHIVFGEYEGYATNHGLEPNGAVWFYMQDFRRGEGLQYRWLEVVMHQEAASLRIIRPGTGRDQVQIFMDTGISEVYLQFFKLAIGLELDGIDESPGETTELLPVDQELLRFFHTDITPKFGALNTAGSGSTFQLTNISTPVGLHEHRWLVIGVNKTDPSASLDFSIGTTHIDEVEWLSRGIPGPGDAVWDIALIHPKYLTESETGINITSDTPGSIIDMFWSQRTYPDSQYRDQVAIPLGLEFADLECER